ncbi:GDSL-type esterase/lipase family protein [Phytoactinopolyspora halophila]|uniref:GDSL-type esterase/lipase family protein n=1 Tax=Phytoactinopolyspora halophila TaxID=1981511 RepID=UPI0013149DA2|nr:GDSL-type esterase/lipase family protein [Phytoactinopolyspora halophila]
MRTLASMLGALALLITVAGPVASEPVTAVRPGEVSSGESAATEAATLAPSSRGEIDPPRVRIRRNPPAGVVSLGDSYSSGLGVGEYDDDCDRTPQAWGMLIFSDEIAPSDRQLLACSGATISDVYDQLDDLEGGDGPGERLITLTVGGNDIGFAGELARCFVPLVGCASREDVLADRIDALVEPLRQLYLDVQDAAPADTLIVGGYPLLVPDPDVRSRCRALTPLLSTEERQMIRRLGGALNEAIEEAATAAGVQSAGSQLEETFDGHEACANEPGDWLHGLKLSWPASADEAAALEAELSADLEEDREAELRWSVVGTFVRDSFHPTVEGQFGYAEAFTRVWSQPH